MRAVETLSHWWYSHENHALGYTWFCLCTGDEMVSFFTRAAPTCFECLQKQRTYNYLNVRWRTGLGR